MGLHMDIINAHFLPFLHNGIKYSLAEIFTFYNQFLLLRVTLRVECCQCIYSVCHL